MTDQQIKDSMLKLLKAPDKELVRMIVAKHLQNSPYLRMKMTIWLNADHPPWQSGVTLLEISENIAIDNNPNFCPIEFGPHGGWPRLRVIEAHRIELNAAATLAEAAGETPFIDEVEKKLIDGTAMVVYPDDAGLEDWRKLLAEPWNAQA